MKLEYLKLWYPEGRQDMISLSKTCATGVLFAPQILKDEDAVIYVDTDVIFMAPPEQLWELFARFDGKQIAAMADLTTAWINRSQVCYNYNVNMCFEEQLEMQIIPIYIASLIGSILDF